MPPLQLRVLLTVVEVEVFGGEVCFLSSFYHLGLHLFLLGLLHARDHRRLYRAIVDPLVVGVLGRLGDQLEDVEDLLVAELDQVSELLGPLDLLVDSHVVDSFPHDQPLLLHEAIHIFLRLERVVQGACGLGLHHLFAQVLDVELLGLGLLARHGIAEALHLVQAGVVHLLLKILLIVFLAVLPQFLSTLHAPRLAGGVVNAGLLRAIHVGALVPLLVLDLQAHLLLHNLGPELVVLH
mmetsp:Transcript_4407/g.7485  ORF Transcript_4407/g.7485 Transcript_4407/m.7485 type:complete len:238 (-) Transcript_4407:655-1368(-)